MEDIVKKIIETEKISSEEINSVTDKYKAKIEEVRNRLEEEKNNRIKEIIHENKVKKNSAVEETRKQIDKELNAIKKNKENLLNNIELCEIIKKDIISTVL